MAADIATIAELERKLKAEGCHRYLLNQYGDDEFCLVQQNNEFVVGYTERGFLREELFRSSSQAQACEFMYQQIMQIRHDHLAGLFASRTDADEFMVYLRHLGIQHHLHTADGKHRVFVYGRDVHVAQNHFGDLPRTSTPAIWEQLELVLARAKFFDEFVFPLREPVSDVESQVWSALEHAVGWLIPLFYARFILQIANGGVWNSATRYMGYEEVLQHNDANAVEAAIPQFIKDLIQTAQQGDFSTLERSVNEGYATGLVRITQWSYNAGALHLTKHGVFIYTETLDNKVHYSVAFLSEYDWLMDLITEVLESIALLEELYARLCVGDSLSELEQVFSVSSSLEWRHSMIAKLIGAAPTDLEPKIRAWQAQHRPAWWNTDEP
jgi:hypothetical protein